ncbi:YD repeat protein [Paenibacillus curdlanolyticus YK9]|uniref:YD repeat protein n=1 Tax=Paenibacillus curdlanolyticus YK9 TaxID=717606 RepID=E0I5I3_9BACL|nr:SpvB/TcaC N-terminal domain-containing protein [Paenibacillus curdlanolyticus]EFM12225.1 YD repeat protein [Paenibacillus curdlanolyticus YK9]
MQSKSWNSEQERSEPFSKSELSLPKGGGAVRGIGETFEPDLFTGSMHMSIPIYASPCREFEPELKLQYSSGSGNGVYGLGFSLSASSISRRTDTGIPTYDSTDRFLLDGEEIIPKLDSASLKPLTRTEQDGEQSWTISEYMHRMEGSFAKIEFWQSVSASYWRIISSNNICSIYGQSATARVADPERPVNVFQWNVEQETDAKGNKRVYTYVTENQDNVPNSLSEQNRQPSAAVYLQRIQYGNYIDANKEEKFAFQLVLDYGEYELSLDSLNQAGCKPYVPQTTWPARADAFSTYRSGFEVRMHRICRQILMFHQFAELGAEPCLVRMTRFNYAIDPLAKLNRLASVEMIGCQKQEDGRYRTLSTPPLAFTYETFEPDKQAFRLLQTEDGYTIPGYLDGSSYEFTDLYGEGLSGILQVGANSAIYWEPLGDGVYQNATTAEQFPLTDGSAPESRSYTLTSLNGDGVMDLIVTDSQWAGFYATEYGRSWNGLQSFTSFPLEYLQSPFPKEMSDMQGDGVPDLVVFEDRQIKIYPSINEEGYGNPISAEYAERDSAHFPLGSTDSAKEIVTFADFIGDGLSHRVRIRNGSVECWPSLGYGRFASVIRMEQAPYFDDSFNASRLFLGDLSGSGLTDLVYVYPDRADVYLNQGGNAFSPPISVFLPEFFGEVDRIQLADILGNGCQCLLFTKVSTESVKHYYYDFSGGHKPNLLIRTDNGIGAITDISYASSVQFYMEDKRAGQRWETILPFPVHVVEQVRLTEACSGNQFVTSYKYHEGYYDPVEKEFRGFGYVEQWDAEEGSAESDWPETAPVYWKRWFHTGSARHSTTLSRHFQEQYYKQDALAYAMPDSQLDEALRGTDGETLRQCYVALKGLPLREEVYGLDQPGGQSEHPYTVNETNYAVKLVQGREAGLFASLLVQSSESIDYQYERDPSDPRMSHEMVVETDAYGHVTKAIQIHYPRRQAQPLALPEQQQVQVLLHVKSYANETEAYRMLGVEYESQSYALFGMQLSPNAYFHLIDLQTAWPDALANVIPYGTSPTAGVVQAELLSWSREYYWNAEQTDALPLGKLTGVMLHHHGEHAVTTPDQISKLFDVRLTDKMMGDDCGYVLREGYWWNQGLVQHYAYSTDNRFHLPWKLENTLLQGNANLYHRTEFSYDPYCLVPTSTTQFLSETASTTMSLALDYNLIKPSRTTDVNGNTAQILYDPLGMVIATSLFGTLQDRRVGDGDLAGYVPVMDASFEDVLAQPERYLQQASAFTYYDVFAWGQGKGPNRTVELYRETSVSEQTGDESTRILINVSYMDGLGRVIETRKRADGGEAYEPAADATGTPTIVTASVRWLVSGRTAYDHKGRPVEQFLPYYSTVPMYDEQVHTADLLPPPTVTHYDPLSRVYRVDSPKGFYTKTLFSPWEEAHYDANDTIADSRYYEQFMRDYPSEPDQSQMDEKDALLKAFCFRDTPVIQIKDHLGRVFLKLDNNLGETSSDLFNDMVKGSVLTAADVWNELVQQGYVDLTDSDKGRGRASARFRPYAPGFQLTVDAKFQPFVDSIIVLLRQSCLPEYTGYDSMSNVLYEANARNYYASSRQEGFLKDVQFAYDMQNRLLRTDSQDAGTRIGIDNLFDLPVHTWDSRGFHTATQYDGLQRPLQIRVDGTDHASDLQLAQTVERYVYGDNAGLSVAEAQNRNLCGKLYTLFDQAGVTHNHVYSLQGHIMEMEQTLLADYTSEPNWGEGSEPALNGESFVTSFDYDGIGRLIAETSADKTVYRTAYNLSGRLQKVSVDFPEQSNVPFIEDVQYDANGQHTLITRGNGTATSFAYEATTQRLLGIVSSRSAADAKGIARNPILQKLTYTMDPVGNITRSRDNSFQTVFQNQQIVEPLSDYTYDALYRLTRASGRQHPGILPDTYATGFKQSQWLSANPPHLNDADKLENYTEYYTYDEAGNKVQTRHVAASASWTRAVEISEHSNRLKAMTAGSQSGALEQLEYDNNGNLLALEHLRALEWNYRNNLANATIVERDGDQSDRSYFVYDSSGHRVRKVQERKISDGLTEIQEKIYVGRLEIKRITRVQNEVRTLILERHSYRVMEDARTAAIANLWTKDDTGRETDTIGKRQLRYQLSDYLGSSTMEVDEDACLISYEEYLPFGGTSYITGMDQREVQLKEYRYSGKERDDCTGLYYYGARYYPPWLGCWINADPAGTADGLNMYAFVGGNPISFVDPNGMARVKNKVGKVKGKNGIAKKKITAQIKAKQRKDDLKRFSSGDSKTKADTIETLRGRKLRVTKNRQIHIRKQLHKAADRAQMELDQFDVPPSSGRALPVKVANPTGVQGLFTFGIKHDYIEKQQIVSKASLNVDGRDSTNDTMGKASAFHNTNNLPASLYSKRDDSGYGGLGEAWCHLIAHCLGGAESSDNLVAGSQGSNLVQLGLELAVKDFVSATGEKLLVKAGANVRLKADGTMTHIADEFFYQIYDMHGKQVYATKFGANILRADTLQKEKRTEAMTSLKSHFGY